MDSYLRGALDQEFCCEGNILTYLRCASARKPSCKENSTTSPPLAVSPLVTHFFQTIQNVENRSRPRDRGRRWARNPFRMTGVVSSRIVPLANGTGFSRLFLLR